MSTVDANKLIAHFQYMYDNNWGYIWGKSGQMWTEKQQKAATREMTVKYGSRWIGHYVTDCSGAFVYAFKQEGAKIYHGSDTIFKKYCSSKGKLVHGAREDGEPIKPGTAVFLLKDGCRHHIGLYIGGDMCIEAKGTINGVVTSRLDHWDEWGELSDVDYTKVEPVDIKPLKRMLRQGCKGKDVEELQRMLEEAGYAPGMIDGIFGKNTKAAVESFQGSRGLKVDGIVGPQTWKALEPFEPGEAGGVETPEEQTVEYTVTITGLSKEMADDLLAKYPTAVIA